MNAMYISKELSLKKIKKITKKSKRKSADVEMLVISKSLKNDKEFMEQINNFDIPIADGRWLFKYLIVQVIEYITICEQRQINDLNIAFLSDDYNELIGYYIRNLIEKVSSLRIITNERRKFEKIERELFESEGNILIISNNKKRGLKEADIAFNFNFGDERINRFYLNPKMILINLKRKTYIESRLFDGININFYEISFENKILEIYKWLEDFKNTDIYESYLYRNDKIENIMNIISKDNVKIRYLVGNNGKIFEREYLNLLDKRHNLS